MLRAAIVWSLCSSSLTRAYSPLTSGYLSSFLSRNSWNRGREMSVKSNSGEDEVIKAQNPVLEAKTIFDRCIACLSTPSRKIV